MHTYILAVFSSVFFPLQLSFFKRLWSIPDTQWRWFLHIWHSVKFNSKLALNTQGNLILDCNATSFDSLIVIIWWGTSSIKFYLIYLFNLLQYFYIRHFTLNSTKGNTASDSKLFFFFLLLLTNTVLDNSQMHILFFRTLWCHMVMLLMDFFPHPTAIALILYFYVRNRKKCWIKKINEIIFLIFIFQFLILVFWSIITLSWAEVTSGWKTFSGNNFLW